MRARARRPWTWLHVSWVLMGVTVTACSSSESVAPSDLGTDSSMPSDSSAPSDSSLPSDSGTPSDSRAPSDTELPSDSSKEDSTTSVPSPFNVLQYHKNASRD